MKSRHTIDPEELERLKKEVENFVDFPIKGPDDYSRLSATLQAEGCGYVSATTLKRIWGYISDTGSNYNPSAYTVTSLCNLIGFKDFDEFSASDFPIQSREYTGKFVESRLLSEGTMVELRWQPNRICKLHHLKGTLFKVVSVESSSRLSAGDVVECSCFTQHAPAFIRIFHEGKLPTTYVAGSANGITYRIIVTDNPEPET